MALRYCRNCLQPDTRPNIRFDAEGVCPPCRYAESLAGVDWDERRKLLGEIVAFGRANNRSGYDCIIGVSGGKDSTRQAMFVKEELRMKPLLVSLNYPPAQLTHRGAHNISNMIELGFDTLNVGPSPQVWKRLMREGFLEHGNWARSTELCLISSVPRLAVTYQIPLVFWGENPAHTLGELGNQSDDFDGRRMRDYNTLSGADIRWLMVDGIEERNLLMYRYPSDDEMDRAGLRIVYLGFFWDRWSKLDNGIFSSLHGISIRTEKPEVIGEILGVDALDEDWVALNQMIKYYKFGFGKVTEIVSEEIRYRGMPRPLAVELVKRYDGRCSEENVDSFCRFLGLSRQQFWEVVDRFVNRDLFARGGDGRWRPTFEVA